MSVKEKDKNRDNNLSRWESAICDAENEIMKAKARIHALTESIDIFKRKIKSGEPWPGDSSTQN